MEITLPITYNIVVTPETCCRGEAKTVKGKSFYFELIFNEVSYPEPFTFTVTTEKANLNRRYIAERCIMSILKKAVATKYKTEITYKGFCVYNIPYFTLKQEVANG